MSIDEPKPTRPLLRMKELVLQNFRTFVNRTAIPFAGPDGIADEIAVFHGDNAAGKSNALAALDFFFLGAALSLRQKTEAGDILIPWNQKYHIEGFRPIWPDIRDRPHGSEGPMRFEVLFADPRLGRLLLLCVPSGGQVRIQLLRQLDAEEPAPIPMTERDQLFTWLVTPRGLGSQPLSIVDARRGQPRFFETPTWSLLPAPLGHELFAMRTSRNPQERNVWRVLIGLLWRFEALKGKEITIEAVGQEPARPEVFQEAVPYYDIVVEDRGRSVLELRELSSGEQQLIVLCASSITGRAGILSIQEPELSLDINNQKIFLDILKELCANNVVDQIILESHVPLFDGPSVIRFERDSKSASRVTRQPSQSESARQTEKKVEEQGATQRWVTRGGYTQLPEKMMQELALSEGGHVWFLKGKSHWEAWPEAEVNDLFGADDSHE